MRKGDPTCLLRSMYLDCKSLVHIINVNIKRTLNVRHTYAMRVLLGRGTCIVHPPTFCKKININFPQCKEHCNFTIHQYATDRNSFYDTPPPLLKRNKKLRGKKEKKEGKKLDNEVNC